MHLLCEIGIGHPPVLLQELQNPAVNPVEPNVHRRISHIFQKL
jgi:hypothetical protein